MFNIVAVLLYSSSLLPHVVGLIFWNWHTTNPHALEQATVIAHPAAASCLNDTDCARGSFCDLHYRLCKPRRQLGEPCRLRDQCAHRLDCSFGRCSTPIPQGEQGARCKGDEDCNVGLCCARRHGARVCKRKLAPMQNCFIPDGGLTYYLNELCPCEEGYVCRAETEMNQRFPLAPTFLCRLP
uniref:Dickkopf N-terminal cysteine-rich domain-containing protein n=1 Tax=Plectus sambesii TaxID=2011161 RepID=A0A914W257_9BILA